MYRIALLMLVSFSWLSINGQDNTTKELKALYDGQKYDQMIAQFAPISKELSAKSLYYLGFAYYMKADDANSLKFMNLSLLKDNTDPETHYVKGANLNFLQRPQEAITSFQKAISLKPDAAQAFSGLGDAYYSVQQLSLSLQAYKKATEQKDCPERPYAMIALIYSETNDNENALAAFYITKLKVAKGSDAYLNALYNIALIESKKGNYDKAESALLELTALDPTDYPAIAKLIQVYYHKKELGKAKPYKGKLYEAYKKGTLDDNLKDMFCFDQFNWNDKLVQAYERYEEGVKGFYIKHLFYVINKNEEVEFRIQTESSPVSIELGGPKYLLCMTKGNMHSTFNIGFKEEILYDDLQKAIIQVLEGKVKATSTSQTTTK